MCENLKGREQALRENLQFPFIYSAVTLIEKKYNFASMQFECLTTPRLVLRKLTPEVYDFVFQNYSEDELRSFLGIASEEQFQNEKDRQEKGRAMYNRDVIVFQLIDKESQKVIGSCSLHNWYYLHRRSELGYAVTDEAFKNKGFMTEAVEAVIDYGFNQIGLNRIEAFVAPYNTPSRKIMEKFHFKEEGFMKQHYFYDGKFDDSLVFGLLREEYLVGG